MLFTLSPSMNLPIPTVGQQPGPEYALNVNAALTLIDQHDHTAGNGVAITPQAININEALTFNNNPLTSVSYTQFTPQTSTPSALDTFYVKGVDAYFIDGNGNDVRITQSGGVAGSPGSITNLTLPASVTYVAVSKTFVFQSDVSAAANLDGASVLLRNITPNSTYALTLQPPATLSNNYSITLPTLPASTSFLTMSSSGGMVASVPTAGGITGSNIGTATITGSNIAAATIQGSNIAASTVALSNMAFTPTLGTQDVTASGTVVVPAGCRGAIIQGCGGGGGGGATNSTAGAAGGNGAALFTYSVSLTPGEGLVVTIGGGGSGSGTWTSPGSIGGTTVVYGSFGTLSFRGGFGGGSTGTTTAGTPDGNITHSSGVGTVGGAGGAPAAAGSNGDSSVAFAGGTGGAVQSGLAGGGGGGAGPYGAGGAGGVSGGGGAPPGAGPANSGAGGGGAGIGASWKNGASGGSGRVRITWVQNI